MTVVNLADGRRVIAVYAFDRDWWTARLEGDEQMAAGHWLHAVMRNLLEIPKGAPNPGGLMNAVQRLARRDTPAGPRVLCRCCGFVTLVEYGGYELCPVCDWEDDPTARLSR